MPGMFSGKTVIVTGAGKGIGRAIVEGFVQEDVKLCVAVTMSQSSVDSLKAMEAAQPGGCVAVVQADLGKDAAGGMAEAVKVLDDLGLGLDFLVNNAGIALCEPLLEVTQENLRQVLEVNAVAPMICESVSVHKLRFRVFLSIFNYLLSECTVVTLCFSFFEK